MRGTRSIHYMGHIKMMGATQPFLSGAISKTVNVPKHATVEDIQQAYIDSWRIGAKAVSIYRDGSKRTQPLNTSKAAIVAAGVLTPEAVAAAGPRRRKLPDERQAITHKFDIAGHEGYITVGLYEDGHAGRDLPGHGEGRLDDLAASPTPSRRRSATRSSTACRCRSWWTSSATSASSRRG